MINELPGCIPVAVVMPFHRLYNLSCKPSSIPVPYYQPVQLKALLRIPKPDISDTKYPQNTSKCLPASIILILQSQVMFIAIL